MEKLLTAATAIVIAIPVSACGTKQDVLTSSSTGRVDVLAPAPLPPATICIFSAQATGAYAQAGLAVEVASDQAMPAARTADAPLRITVMKPSLLLKQRDSGAPLLSVARLTEQSLTYGAADPNALSSSPKAKIAAEAKLAGNGPGDPAVLSVTRADASNRGDVLRRFLQATGRACDSAPKAGLKAWKAAGGKAKVGKRKTPVAALQPNVAARGNPWGWQPPGQWTALVGILTRQGTLKGAISPDTAYSNEFLAGQGS